MPVLVKVKWRTSLLGWAAMGLLPLSVPMFAHHGASAFDPNKEITLQGTVTAFVFSNPHVRVVFDVAGGHGAEETWEGELTAPNNLIRSGWNKRTLRPGERITVTGFQAWRGERALWIRKIAGSNGRPLLLGGG